MQAGVRPRYHCALGSGHLLFMLYLKRVITAAAVLTLLAACGGRSDKADTPPVPPPDLVVTGFELSPSSLSLETGEEALLEGEAGFNNGTTQDVPGADVTWTSSDPAVASVSEAGLVTAVTAGNVVVSGTYRGFTDESTVTVTAPVPPPGTEIIAIQTLPPLIIRPEGSTRQVRALAFFDDMTVKDVTGDVSWSSANENIATVDASGLVTIIDAGQTTISGELDGRQDAVRVIGINAPLESIEVTPASADIIEDTEVQLSAIGTYQDGEVIDITDIVSWRSSDEAVMRVSPDGTVLGISPGEGQATAELRGVSDSSEITVVGKAISELQLEPYRILGPAGTQAKHTLTAFFEDGTTEDVSDEANWSSTNPDSIEVGDDGTVFFNAVGNAVIEAQFRDKLAFGSDTVTNAEPTGLIVLPPRRQLPAGTSKSFVAVATFTDGSTRVVSDEADWQVTDVRVARVDENGRVYAVAVGETEVVAHLGGITANATVTVTDPFILSLTATPAEIEGFEEDIVFLLIKANHSDGSVVDITLDASYGTSDGLVAVVNQAGQVLLTRPGEAEIKVQYRGAPDLFIPVTVIEKVRLNRVDITPVTASIPSGTTLAYTATAVYSDGTSGLVKADWQSTNLAVATISADGVATGIATGATEIVGTFNGVAGRATLTVDSAELSSLQITPASVSGIAGTTTQLTATAFLTDGRSVDVTDGADWTVGDTAVALVGSRQFPGLVYFVGAGTTSVQAMFDGVSASGVVRTIDVALDSVVMTPASRSVALGAVAEYTLTAIYNNGDTIDVTASANWQTADPLVAVVDDPGRIATLSTGTTTVTASFDGKQAQGSLEVTDAVLTRLEILPPGGTAPAGIEGQLVAKATYSDGTVIDAAAEANWLSTDPNIVEVGATGYVRLRNAGQANVSVSWDGLVTRISSSVSDEVSVTVTEAALRNIVVTPGISTVAAGLTRQFTATGEYTDNTTQDITDTVNWQTAEPAIATVDTSGLATGVATGDTEVTATLGNISGKSMLTVTAAEPVSIAVTPASASHPVGFELGYTAAATLSDSQVIDVTNQASWVSSAPGIVSITANTGVASFVAEGTAEITATFMGLNDTADAEVTAAELVSLKVTPGTQSIALGLTEQYVATGTYSDNTSADLTDIATWQSSDTGVAVIDLAGLATSLATGTTTISANVGAISDTAELTVTAAEVDELVVTPSILRGPAGTTEALTATAFFTDGSDQDVTSVSSWISSDNSVASVVAGSVDLEAEGQAVITATYNGKSDAAVASVTAAEIVSISLSPPSVELAVGIPQQFTATATYTDSSVSDVTAIAGWSSSDAAVSVSQGGEAIGVTVGSADITASLSGKTGTASFTATQAILTSLEISPPSVSKPEGTEQQLSVTAYFSDNTSTDATADATWQSSAPAVIEMGTGATDPGLARMLSEGDAELSATWNGQRAAVRVTSNLSDSIQGRVTAAELSEIIITPAQATVPSGLTAQYQAQGVYTNGDTVDLTTSVRWRSDNTSIATIASSGLATAEGVGSANISAALGAVSSSASITVTSPELQSLQVTPANPRGAAGTTTQLRADAFYTDGSTQDVTAQTSWSTANTSIATVDSSTTPGLLYFVSTGTTTLTAAFDTKTVNAVVVVSPAELVSINVTPASTSVAAGVDVTYAAEGIYSDNTSQDLTDQVTWQSSNTSVASIAPDGTATTLAAGSVTITAGKDMKSGTASLVVTDAAVVGITILPPAVTGAAGTTRQLLVLANYTNGDVVNVTSSTTWSSSAPLIASVSGNGSLMLDSPGTAQVTASFDAAAGVLSNIVTDTISVEVTAAVLTAITVTPANESVAAGLDVQYRADGLYSDNSQRDITSEVSWQSSDPSVATIASTGLATSLVEGSTTVTASLGALSDAVPLTVTAATVSSVQILPGVVEGPAGTTTQLSLSATYTDGTTQDVTTTATFVSADPAIASVIGSGTNAGETTLNTVGTTSISGTFSGFTDSVNVTVTQAELVSVDIEPISPSVAAGLTVQFSLSGEYTDGTRKPLPNATWTSGNTSVAVVDLNGLATTLIEGASNITGSFGGKSDATTLTVTAAQVESVQLTPANTIEPAGNKVNYQLQAYFSDGSSQDVTSQAVWTSSAPDLVSITGTGNAEMLKPGTSTITGTFETKSDMTLATVTDAELVSITVTPQNATSPAGIPQPFTATGEYTDGSSVDITAESSWSSSDTNVASIDSDGVATGLKAGSVTISAVLDGKTGPSTFAVTDAVLESLSITPTSLNEPAGAEVQLSVSGTFSDGSVVDATSQASWSSSNDLIIDVVATGAEIGLARMLSEGTATITARWNGIQAILARTDISDSIQGTVTAAELVSIAVTPVDTSIADGESVQYKAEGAYTDSTTSDLTNVVTWQTGATGVATISTAGLAKGESAGATSVTATLGSISDSTGLTVTEKVAQRVVVTPLVVSEPVGTTGSFQARVIFSDQSVEDVTQDAMWLSDDTGVATVVSAGTDAGGYELTGVGSTVVRATFDSLEGRSLVTVSPVALTQIQISPPIASSPVGIAMQFNAAGIYSDNSDDDITSQVTWTSSDPAVLTIDATGSATGVTPGQVIVTAALDGITDAAIVEVTPAVVTSVVVTPPNFNAPAGTQQQMTLTAIASDGTSEDATASATWTSSDDQVVNVGASTGLAQLLKEGAANITATLGGLSDTVTITVTPAVLVEINVSPATETIPAGVEQRFTAIGIYSNGDAAQLSDEVAWSSGNPAVAVIDMGGIATGTAVGTTTISASKGSIVGSAMLEVTAAQLQVLQILPVSVSEPVGTQTQLTVIATFTDGSIEDATREATWTSSAPDIIDVDTSDLRAGQLTMLQQGEAVITAIWNGDASGISPTTFISDSITAEAIAAQLSSIQVLPPIADVPVGLKQAYTATGFYTDGSSTDVTSEASWTSSDVSVAKITDAAVATGSSVGSTTISASLNFVTGTSSLQVVEPTLLSLTITPAGLIEPAGTSGQLTLTVVYSDGSALDVTTLATWNSSNNNVAQVVATGVNAGFAELISKGTSKVTAQFEGEEDEITIEVTDAVLVSISVLPQNDEVPVGIESQYAAIGIFSDGTSTAINEDVSWSSSDYETIVIDPAGVARGVAVGSAEIRAALEEVIGSTKVTVTGAALTGLQITPPGLQQPKGTTNQLAATAYYSDGTTQDATREATWSSSLPRVAAVSTGGDDAGKVFMLDQGTAEIFATWDGLRSPTSNEQTDSIDVIVTQIELIQIQVTPFIKIVPNGVDVQYTATGIYTDGTSADITDEAAWRTSDNAIAIVTQDGFVESLSVGQVVVTASLDSVEGNAALDVTAAQLESLQVTPTGLTEPAGTGGQLTATALYTDGSNQDVTENTTWVSSDTSIADVVPSGVDAGLVQLLSPGEVTITATFQDQSGTSRITVTDAELVQIVIDPQDPEVSLGNDLDFDATGIFTDGTSTPINEDVSWQSSSVDVATIDTDGGITGVAVGTTTITATLDDISASTTLTVSDAIVVRMDIFPPDYVGIEGTGVQLFAAATYSDGRVEDVTSSVTWTSDDPAVALVDSSEAQPGFVTLVSEGSTTIRVNWDPTRFVFSRTNVSAEAPIVVRAAELESIEIEPAFNELAAGLQDQYFATGIYTNGERLDITTEVSWRTSNSLRASVTQTGLVTAIASGDVVISAQQGAITETASLEVTDALLQSLQITPQGVSAPEGSSEQFELTGNYSDGSTQDLTRDATWISSDSDVVGVVPTGVLAGRADLKTQGSATISAIFGELTETTDVTVTANTLVDILIEPDDARLRLFSIETYEATGIYDNGDQVDITDDVTWLVVDPDIATITQSAILQARAIGTTSVTATLDDVTGSVPLEVVSSAVVFLEVTPVASDINIGQQVQYKAVQRLGDFSLIDVTRQATWTVSDASLATISNSGEDTGLLTPIAAGDVIVTARYFGQEGEALATISDKVLQSVEILPGLNPVDPADPDSYEMVEDTTSQWSALARFSDGSTADITTDAAWQSRDTKKATVTDTGLVETHKKGDTDITITFLEMSDQVALEVTDVDLSRILIDPPNATLLEGVKVQFEATGVYVNGQQQNITDDVKWKTSDKDIVKIKKDGEAEAKEIGTANITAEEDGITSMPSVVEVVSPPVDADDIRIEPATFSERAGATWFFRAYAVLDGGEETDVTDSVVWSSDNPANVSVVSSDEDAGLVELLQRDSSAVITATLVDQDISGTAAVTVTDQVADCSSSDDLDAVRVEPSVPDGQTFQMEVDDQVQFNIYGVWKEPACEMPVNKDARWTSVKEEFLRIDDQGLATALRKEGGNDEEAEIDAEFEDKKFSFKININ